MSGYLLDTHVLLWLTGNQQDAFTAETLSEFTLWQAEGTLYFSAETVWEVALLTARQRIALPVSVDVWTARLIEQGVSLLPLTVDVLITSTRLPGELHRDPSDRKLLATALVHGLTLVTRDKLLVEYGRQGFVRVMER